MIIDCISDLHGAIPELNGGDLLIIAGDLTARDLPQEYQNFFEWLRKQQYERIVWIAGNHDGCLTKEQVMRDIKNSERFPASLQAKKIEYLQDSETEFRGLKIWGSPWTPTFFNWYFMKDRGPAIKEMWDKIPLDTNILITHGPPLDILDTVAAYNPLNIGNHAGCEDLAHKVKELEHLRMHVFGHIHESYGILESATKNIKFVNASIMNENLDPVNKPIRIIL